ncbi:hypothetical protein [Propioniciclava soli]|uniref:hypothetical protein n=1 Tax=Propioniciclava soli TaxID=2775081 RepID=UPI001E2D9800|nr:hypothetical protein [Propioniciclava soli]
MIRWRGAFLAARVIPMVVSLAIVFVAEALQTGALLVWLAGSVGWAYLTTKTMRLWRLGGVRRPVPAEVEVVRASMGLVPGLRGRREPRLWLQGGDQIYLATRRDLVVGRGWSRYLLEGGSAEVLAAGIAAAAARGAVTRRTWVVALDTLCLPGKLAIAPLRVVVASRPGLMVWMYTWLVILGAVATVQQTAAGRWPAAVGLVVLVAACFAGPAWEARWRAKLDLISTAQTAPAMEGV